METIKKTILQAVTTGRTGNGEIIIEPDPTVVYYFKIGLKQKPINLGFFDPTGVEETQYPYGLTPIGIENLY